MLNFSSSLYILNIDVIAFPAKFFTELEKKNQEIQVEAQKTLNGQSNSEQKEQRGEEHGV